MRSQPVVEPGQQGSIGEVGPRLARRVAAVPGAQAQHAGLPLAHVVGPGQRPQSLGFHGGAHRLHPQGFRHLLQRAAAEQQAAITALAGGGQRAAAAVPGHRVAAECLGFQHRDVQRRGQIQAALAAEVIAARRVEVGGHQIRLPGQIVALRQPHALAAGQQVAVRAAGPQLGGALGIRQKQQPPHLIGCGKRRVGLDAQQTAPLPTEALGPLQHGPVALAAPPSPVLAQGGHPPGEVAAGAAWQRVAFFEQRGEVGGQCAEAQPSAHRQQVCQARVGRQIEQAPALRGDAACLQGVQLGQQRLGRLHAHRGRGVEPGQVRDVGSPARHLQHQRREVGSQDFWRSGRREQRLGALAPQAVGHPRRGASRPPGALIGAVAGHAAGHQAAQAGAGVELLAAGQAAVDDHPHAVDGQAGFGDAGRQHDLAPRGVRHDGAVLLGDGQITVERQHRHLGVTFAQRGQVAANLGHARQEGQHVAGMVGERPRHRARHRRSGVERIGGQVAHVYRVLTAPTLDDRHRMAQPGR